MPPLPDQSHEQDDTRRSEILPDEERLPDTGDLVDQTFRMLQKRRQIDSAIEILVGDALDEETETLRKLDAVDS